MYNKTTSANYLRYGSIVSNLSKFDNFSKTRVIVDSKITEYFYSYDEDIVIELIEGMAVIVILDENYKIFAIHRKISLNKDTPFTVLPMSNVALYNIYVPENSLKSTHPLPEAFLFENITGSVIVKEIDALYYAVKSPNYRFHGEIHHMFELTYVDHGTLVTEVDGQKYELNENECMIYYPGQFHTQEVISNESCSYITIIFDCSGISNSNLFNRTFHCSRELVGILEMISKNTDAIIAYRNDLLVSYLQLLIIKLLQHDENKTNPKPTTLINQHFENMLLEEILTYINNHLFEPLPVDQICAHFSISRSSLQNLFKNNLYVSPKHYINEEKLSLSRVLIKKGEQTISEISNQLGFTSIHYFSRKFTRRFGIAPSEYARKIYD